MRDKCSVWGSAQPHGLPCRLKRVEIVCLESLVGMGTEQCLSSTNGERIVPAAARCQQLVISRRGAAVPGNLCVPLWSTPMMSEVFNLYTVGTCSP